MKHFIISILLSFAFFSFPFAKANLPDDPFSPFDNSELSVWQVFSSEENTKSSYILGTGFFIGENQLITAAHVISRILSKATDGTHIALLQEGSDTVIRVKRVLALSFLYDLALLEVEENVTNFLSLRETPLELDEELFFTGYPQGILKKIRKTGNISEYDNDYYFSVAHSSLGGASGSPVLDQLGQVIGVLYGSSENILEATKVHHLKRFITKKDIGTQCRVSNPDHFFPDIQTCIKEEMEHLHELAEQGYHLAQYKLADMYYRTGMMTRDPETAFYWCEKAAEQAYRPAQILLARMYEEEEETEQSLQRSAYWYEEAAKQGSALAQHNLANMYRQGRGLNKSPQKALDLYRVAAEQNYAPAQNSLADMLSTGEGNAYSFQEVLDLYQAAAEQGYAPAQHNLADIYMSEDLGMQDFQKAAYWYEEAAKQGYALSQHHLAFMYEAGKGVKRDIEKAIFWYAKAAKQDFPPARIWLEMLAKQGFASAQYEWALIKEMDQQIEDAIFWYNEAARGGPIRRGHVLSQYHLAVIYSGGVTKSSAQKAYQWFKKAAKRGHAPSQYELALIYERGRQGFFSKHSKDLSKTYYWLMEASKQIYPPAFSKLIVMVCSNEGAKEDIDKAIRFFKEISSEHDIPSLKDCLDLTDLIHNRNQAIAGAGAGVIAATGMEQGFIQNAESSSPARADSIGAASHSEGSGFELREEEFPDVSVVERSTSELEAEFPSEWEEDIVSEVGEGVLLTVADLGLDFIPGVGAVKGVAEAAIGISLLSGRRLTASERWWSVGLAPLNLFGAGAAKVLLKVASKNMKYVRLAWDPVSKAGYWAIERLNTDQLSKFMSLVRGGELEKVEEYLKTVISSLNGGVSKRYRSVRRGVRRILTRLSSFVDESVEIVELKVSEWLDLLEGRLDPVKLVKPIDVNKLTNPEGPGVLIRGVDGVDELLDVGNPSSKALGLLRRSEDAQREALEILIEGGNRTGRVPITPLIKEGVKESADDFGSLF